jgi:hypothetical protein
LLNYDSGRFVSDFSEHVNDVFARPADSQRLDGDQRGPIFDRG